MSRITLCLIARDEEKLLPDCLASAAGAVDEIVLVDTGSTDRTAAIARAAGARVVDFPWGDDFSAARNEGLRHATGEFVLQLDADERLAPHAARVLRAAVRNARFDAGLLRLHNASSLGADPGDVLSGRARLGPAVLLPRLLRHADGLAYRSRVHETVREWLERRGHRIEPLNADIVHLGCIPDERQRLRKRDRNLELLRRRCEEEPDDITPFGYLALELLEVGQFEEAGAVCERGWRIIPEPPPHRPLHKLAVARAFLGLREGSVQRILESVERAERRDGAHPDLAGLRGSALELAAQQEVQGAHRRLLASHAASCYARAAEDWPPEMRIRITDQEQARLRQGHALILAGRAAQAAEVFAEASRRSPGSREARQGLAEAHLDLGDAARALHTVESAVGEEPDGWLIAAAAAHALGAPGDAHLFLGNARARIHRGLASSVRADRLRSLERDLADGTLAAGVSPVAIQPPVPAASVIRSVLESRVAAQVWWAVG